MVLLVLAVAGVAWIGYKLFGYHQAQQAYSAIETAYASDTTSAADGEVPVDFDELQQEYPSVVAWIRMDDVDLSYPIAQGDDNEFYLHNDPAGQASVSGSIFLDYRNTSLDTDLYAIVYGHNMRDESMFGMLDEYLDEDFYRNSSGSFYIYTPQGAYRYKIFAVDVVDPSSDVYQLGFTNTQVFGAFVEQLKENSIYDTGVQVAGYDHIVTLSTCSSTNRLVISAKRM